MIIPTRGESMKFEYLNYPNIRIGIEFLFGFIDLLFMCLKTNNYF